MPPLYTVHTGYHMHLHFSAQWWPRIRFIIIINLSPFTVLILRAHLYFCVFPFKSCANRHLNRQFNVLLNILYFIETIASTRRKEYEKKKKKNRKQCARRTVIATISNPNALYCPTFVACFPADMPTNEVEAGFCEMIDLRIPNSTQNKKKEMRARVRFRFHFRFLRRRSNYHRIVSHDRHPLSLQLHNARINQGANGTRGRQWKRRAMHV